MRVIKVKGVGKMAVQPDAVVFTFNLEEINSDYEECINNLNKRTASLRSDIEGVSREQTELKSRNFSLQEDKKRKAGSWIIEGYIGRHTLNIEFPVDKDVINLILGTIAGGNSAAEIRINFTVSDKESLRQTVLAEAVRTAQKNAIILAEAAGLRLGQIQQIDYGWAEIRMYEEETELRLHSSLSQRNYSADIEPEDVSAEDRVTLVYEIID